MLEHITGEKRGGLFCAPLEFPHFLNILKCVCACVPMPTHCTITCFGFLARWIEMALNVVYFRITHSLGRPHYVWDEYLYSVREKVEARVTVSVTVCVVLLCCVG